VEDEAREIKPEAERQRSAYAAYETSHFRLHNDLVTDEAVPIHFRSMPRIPSGHRWQQGLAAITVAAITISGVAAITDAPRLPAGEWVWRLPWLLGDSCGGWRMSRGQPVSMPQRLRWCRKMQDADGGCAADARHTADERTSAVRRAISPSPSSVSRAISPSSSAVSRVRAMLTPPTAPSRADGHDCAQLCAAVRDADTGRAGQGQLRREQATLRDITEQLNRRVRRGAVIDLT
jgi:hypothetical protein